MLNYLIGFIIGTIVTLLIVLIFKPVCYGTIKIDRRGIKDVWQIQFEGSMTDIYQEKSIVLKVDTNAELCEIKEEED